MQFAYLFYGEFCMEEQKTPVAQGNANGENTQEVKKPFNLNIIVLF